MLDIGERGLFVDLLEKRAFDELRLRPSAVLPQQQLRRDIRSLALTQQTFRPVILAQQRLGVDVRLARLVYQPVKLPPIREYLPAW